MEVACLKIGFSPVSHLANIRSFSNLANSLRSWILVNTFHIRMSARPMATMAPMTPRTMPMMSTTTGHSLVSCTHTCSSPVSFL